MPWLTTEATDNNNQAGDILARVAATKGVTPTAFISYGAEVDGESAYFPMYGPDGQPCSGFQLGTDGGKGLYAPGKPTGLFLPGRNRNPAKRGALSRASKTRRRCTGWATTRRGCRVVRLAPKFAPLFSGVDVVIVPDGDKAGRAGAEKTATMLAGRGPVDSHCTVAGRDEAQRRR